MEVSITKISKNVQVVIPSNVRKSANITPSTQFLVLNKDGNIILKRINGEEIMEDLELIKKIKESEKDIKERRYVELDLKMSAKEMDKILTGD